VPGSVTVFGPAFEECGVLGVTAGGFLLDMPLVDERIIPVPCQRTSG